MNMTVHKQEGLEVLDETVKGNKADMGGILGIGKAEGRRVGHEDVQLAPVADALQPGAKFEVEGAPAHLSLRVLVGAGLVAEASAESRDAQAASLDDPPFDVLASVRARHGDVELQR
jgi:hypothetical protein